MRRGGILIELDFIKEMGAELKMMNRGKRGRSYKYGERMFEFLGHLYAFIRNYRILEGLCRGFSMSVKRFSSLFNIFHSL
ncbi:hypothetical protein B6U71_03355 [Euryarchaeota archaeon ex4484_178]|nr:MAG: hypothetical protein B6U71_03355 [Euryarchaeota archaeon ex4484_178]